MKKISISLGSVVALGLPMLVFAAPDLGTGSYLDSLFSGATSLLGRILIFLISLAVVWFIWNVIRYTFTADDEEKKAAARSQMVWGIVAIAVIISVWGLVAILQKVFGVNNQGAPSSIDSMIPGGSGSDSLLNINLNLKI